ncbi:M56 family peptidase [Rhodococcus sp. ABRD24]|uniref:M56 family metallopeptidase n=1 Tax=Rhodococcus sp. ABRD24 TaxID=2507582 RepID=UPI00103E86F0|nr:M56 family metallopeptidase [Rhodococcus sp. ABRD24]QBJ96344.1 M56 family peptidase [Rhodococcus sp. ABRD24]
MTLASVLLVGAVLMAMLAAPVLERLPYWGVRPNVVLVFWLASIATALFFASSAVITLAWPDHAPAEGIADAVMRCFSTVQHTFQPWITGLLAVIGLVGAAGLVVRAAIYARKQSVARSRVQDLHRDVIAVVAKTERADRDVMWLEHPVPMAYSVSGRPGFVVATEGLSSSLSSIERDAVLAHERAHLNGHHHLIVSVCDVLASAFPVVPLFVRAQHAVHTVIELAADQQAARATSPAAVSSALSAVAGASSQTPAWTLGLGSDMDLRLWRLRRNPRSRFPRLACCAAAAFTVTVPTVTALAVVSATTMAACIVLT